MENKLNVDTEPNVSTTPRSPRGTTLRTSPLFRPGSESAGHSPRNYSPRPDDTSEANSLFYKAPTTPRDEIEMKELKPSPRPSIRTQGDYSNFDTTYVEPKKGFPTVTGTPLGPEEKTSPKPLPHVGVRSLPRRNSVHPDDQPRTIPVPKLPLGDLQPRHGQFQRKKPPMRKVSVQTGVRESSSIIEPPRPYKTMQSAGESILIDFTNAEGQYEEVTATAIPEQADDSTIPATTFTVLRQLDDKAVVKMKEFGVKNPRVYAPDSYDIPFLVIIPCFNEGPDVMYRTILSVHESSQDLYGKQLDPNNFGAATHAVLLLDGYTKASSASIKWLSEIFSVDIPAENDPWKYLSRLKENKQEDKEVVNWFVDKADKTFCSIAGSEVESYVPSLSWNPAEVYKWVAQFNENTACVLLRNKINGDKLFRLKPDRLCDVYGLSLDDALELRNNIDRVNSITEMSKDKLENIAVIFQRTFHRSLVPIKITRPIEEEEDPLFAKQGCYWNCCDFEKPSKKDSAVTFLTVIIKCRNRQKHNSHWWAIQPDFGFVAQYPNSQYTWFTDCGTLFEKDCLFHLWKALKRKPSFGDSVGAVTGRQRVMNARQQAEKSEGFLSEFLRHVQRCDFELSFASTVGAFATIGVLPVLPGPCALFKNDILLKGANTFYHNFLHMTDIGLIEANVMIAEDRVLSVSPFFVEPSKKSSCCSWNSNMMTDVAPEAIFYFESENNIMSLVKQRRRWINGTVAAYIWMLWKKPGLIWHNFNISAWRKVCLWWLFFTQAYAYFWVFMAPSIFIVAFKIGIEKLPIPQDVYNQLIMNFWWLFLLGMYAIFSLMSSLRWVEDWAMYFGMFIGMGMEIITVASLAYNIVNIFISPPTIIVNNVSQVYYNYYDYSALGIVFIFLGIPFIAALFAQPKSLLYILRSCIPFFLFLPTLVGLLGVYSICNFSDFSWGNRDSTGAEDKLGSRARVLKARGNIFGWLFLLMNLIFTIVSAQLVNAYSLYKLAAAVVVFGPALTVVIVSMIYWICWRVKWLVMTCVHCGRSKPLPLDETRNVKLHNGQPVLTSSSGQPESERVSLTATLGTPHAKPGVTSQNEI